MTVKSFDQHNLVYLLDAPSNQVGANSSWVQPFADGKGADRAVFMLIAGAVGSNDVVLQLYQAQDNAGTGAKIITGATAQVTTTNANGVCTVEIGPGALDNVVDEDGKSTFTWVQARVTASSAEDWTLLYFQHNLRYPGKYDQDATYVQITRLYD